MAKLMVLGTAAQVEILTDPEDEELMMAVCSRHPRAYAEIGRLCTWRDYFDTTDDAWQAAEQHADSVR
jgi:hypothetical protein